MTRCTSSPVHSVKASACPEASLYERIGAEKVERLVAAFYARVDSDPVIRPVEGRLVRLGGNPVNAGWWLVVVVAIGGVVLLSLMDWIVGTFYGLSRAAGGGPRAMLAFLIGAVYSVLFAALLLRVVASWFGAFRYSRWMRPAYALTDWLVEPIRRVLPPMGAVDWSPLVAWLALWVLKQVLLSVVWS